MSNGTEDTKVEALYAKLRLRCYAKLDMQDIVQCTSAVAANEYEIV